jgi:hypothetical protein
MQVLIQLYFFYFVKTSYGNKNTPNGSGYTLNDSKQLKSRVFEKYYTLF